MPGLSRVNVAQSVPTVAANAVSGPSSPIGRGGHFADLKLYSTTPDRNSASVCTTPKSSLKSLPNDEAHGKLQPIRRLYACSFSIRARDTAQSITSWLAMWTTTPLKPSAIAEHDGQPAVKSGPNMKW